MAKGLSTGAWIRMIGAGALLCIGGPALVIYVTPTEEELFKRYNPELQKRSLENRYQKQADFDSFVNKLKEHAKSDKHIWDAATEARLKEIEEEKQMARDEQGAVQAAIEARRKAVRESGMEK